MFKLLTEAQLNTIKAGFGGELHESHHYNDDSKLETWIARGKCRNWFIVEVHALFDGKIDVIIDVAYGRVGYLLNDVYVMSAKDILVTPKFIILDRHIHNVPKYLWQ